MLEEKDQKSKPDNENFDDLDSILNRESKEFTEIVKTMNTILSINKATND